MMPIQAIVAHIECEGCGKVFRVDMDPASEMCAELPSLYDLAVDAVRGGEPCRDGGSCSVQAEMLLCPSCTKVVDNINADDDDYKPIRCEIDEAIEASLYPNEEPQ